MVTLGVEGRRDLWLKTWGGFWHPSNVLFLHLHEFALLLLITTKLYIYVLCTFLYISESNRKRREWSVMSKVVDLPAYGLTLDHWVKQSEDFWCTDCLSGTGWGSDLIGMGSRENERRGIGHWVRRTCRNFYVKRSDIMLIGGDVQSLH